MEQQWEHKIKKAFREKDNNSSFVRKDELWRRISAAKPTGLVLFWKVAALFLGMILLGGVFAATTMQSKLKEKYRIAETRNNELWLLVDSLKNRQPRIVTEIQIVEKEKLIVKKVEVLKPVEQKESYGQTELNSENKELKSKIVHLKEQLDIALDSLRRIQSEQMNVNYGSAKIQDEKKANFKLKTEKVKDQMKTDLIQKTPELKLQLFKSKDDGVQFDVSSTLLKR